MSSDTKSAHLTPPGGNIFADLGFEPDEAAALHARSRRIIEEKLSDQCLREEHPVSSDDGEACDDA